MATDKARGGKGSGWFSDLDRLLRGELTRTQSLRAGGLALDPLRLALVIVALAASYGLCMGAFAAFRADGPNLIQIVASMVKVPLLFFLTLIVTLPSLYVFNALVGSRLAAGAFVRLLVAALAVTTAVLASLGPITAFFSVSTTSYPFMLLFNVAIFAVAGILGLSFLLQTLHRLSLSAGPTDEPAPLAAESEFVDQGALEPVGERGPSPHVRLVFRIWVVVFALVGAQMGWVLRPFVGDPKTPFAWFRVRESNFFQAVFQTLKSLFS